MWNRCVGAYGLSRWSYYNRLLFLIQTESFTEKLLL